MLLAITQKRYLYLLNNTKNDKYRMAENKKTDLFEILDDLFAIDWLQMASNVFYGTKELVDFEFMEHEDFVRWLHNHNCLYKEDIETETYELIQKQFPTFSLESWDRFYNAILFLNIDKYYNDMCSDEQAKLFLKLFPPKSYFSPYAKTTVAPVDALNKFAFSSTLEMIVYDITNEIYHNQDAEEFGESATECRESFVFHLCDMILQLFEYQISGEEIMGEYTIEKFVKEFFIAPWFREINAEVYRRIEILFYLLKSKHMRSIMAYEYNNSKKDQESYGYNKIEITEFINADLLHRFECKNYIYKCYDKYEVTGLDIFNFTEKDNIILLLALYGKIYGKLSFPQCDICGHYFVRNRDNKKQQICNRCKVQTKLWEEIAFLQKEYDDIRQRYDKTRHDIRAKQKKGKYNYADEVKVFDLFFFPLYEAYLGGLKKIIEQVLKEHIRYLYDQLDDENFTEIYPLEFKELKDQISIEKALLSCNTSCHELLDDFSFTRFQTQNLTPNKFLQTYECLPASGKDLLFEENELSQLFLTIISVFSAYNVSFEKIIEIYEDIIRENYDNETHPYVKSLLSHIFAGSAMPEKYR